MSKTTVIWKLVFSTKKSWKHDGITCIIPSNIISDDTLKQIFQVIKVLLLLWVKGMHQIICFYYVKKDVLIPYNSGSPHFLAIKFYKTFLNLFYSASKF